MTQFGRLTRWFGLTMGLVIMASLLVAPSNVAALTTPYRPGDPITLDSNLLSKSGISAWTIDEYLASTTTLPKLGSAFLDAERKYGVNARVLIAAALHESNWGASHIAQTKHNLFGFNAYDHCPATCASRFTSYAQGVDVVASFIKRAYLVSSGRWWGGDPTLRGMQKRWSSSGTWGVNVARIANGLDFSSLRERKIKFSTPSALGTLHSESEASFGLAWKGDLPGGITFVATWTPILLDPEAIAPTSTPTVDPTATPAPTATSAATVRAAMIDSAALDLTSALPTPTAAPTATISPVPPVSFTTKADKTPISANTMRLNVKTPAEPGVYLVTFAARDSDGLAPPAVDQVPIPSIKTRLWAPQSVNYSVAAAENVAGTIVTVTNMGSAAIPAIDPNTLPVTAGRSMALAAESTATVTRFIVRASTGSLDPAGDILANVLLTADLPPGASMTTLIPSPSTGVGALIPSPSTGVGALIPSPSTGSPLYLVAELLVLGDSTYLVATPAQGFWYPVATPVIPVATPVIPVPSPAL